MQKDVFLGGQEGQQAAGLQNIAQMAQAQGRQGIRAAAPPGGQYILTPFRRGGEGKADVVLFRVRRRNIRSEYAGQQIQSRAFAAAAGPGQGEQAAARRVKGREAQMKTLMAGTAFAHAAQRKDQIARTFHIRGPGYGSMFKGTR